MKTFKKVAGWFCIVAVLSLGIAMIAYPAAVTQVAGLAVAQSSTQWNQLKDMAIGDSQTNGAGLFTPCLFNGATCDRARGTIAGGQEMAIKSIATGTAPADAFANPTNSLTTFSLSAGFNGTTWDRLRTATADGLGTTGLLASPAYLFNGATQDRLRSVAGDGQAATGLLASGNMGFNGSTWDRVHVISATHNTATTTNGAFQTTFASTWSVTSTPAVATQASASKALGGGTVRHVAQSITVCIAANATAQPPLLVHLRDGATGAGTIIRTWAFSQPIGTGSCSTQEGLNQTGSANTAMTLETAAAPAAGVQATVTLGGYSTP